MRSQLAQAMMLIVCLVAPITREEVVAFEPQSAPPTVLPVNMIVDPRLAQTIGEMLQCSMTFREQCRQLATLPHVTVRVELSPGARPAGHTSRAECELRKYQYGSIEARVRLWSTDDAAELIAHELEHVLEYAEGVNYQQASLATRRVWLGRHGSYESTRAILAGLRVGEQMSRSRAARASR